jgi:type IV pilus assembly protein PilX
MLIRHTTALPAFLGRDRSPGKEDGVVLMVALIILVALTIGGIALIRSVDTTNLISGNLAFQQAATHAGEMGTEDALATFLEPSAETVLRNDSFLNGYAASTRPGVWLAPGDTAGNPASWDAYWLKVIDPAPKVVPVVAKSCGHGGGRVCTLPTDNATGNTVSYTIQRLCGASGDPADGLTRCASSSDRYAECHTTSCIPIILPTQYYYRITSRVAGPRNTISYVQAIVAISKN